MGVNGLGWELEKNEVRLDQVDLDAATTSFRTGEDSEAGGGGGRAEDGLLRPWISRCGV